MSRRDPLEELLVYLEDPSFQEALGKLVDLVMNLEKSGLLDLLVALTEPEVIHRIMDLVLVRGTLELGDSIDFLLDKLGDIVGALTRDVEPAGLSQVLGSLKDPEVARGLARLVEILRVLGR
ncbi:MAG: DUF1641 domain-containing protein [Desulfurococcales archaeon]|nr:DUF1641 domain-containing protein [Desulfurococcales archaeon]